MKIEIIITDGASGVSDGFWVILGGLVLMAVVGYSLLAYRDEHPKGNKSD